MLLGLRKPRARACARMCACVRQDIKKEREPRRAPVLSPGTARPLYHVTTPKLHTHTAGGDQPLPSRLREPRTGRQRLRQPNPGLLGDAGRPVPG